MNSYKPKSSKSYLRQLVHEMAFSDSESALKELYMHYHARMTRYIYPYVRSVEATEELVSDLGFTLWENRKYLPEVGNLDAYVYQVAKFKSLNYIRGRKMDTVDFEDLPFELFDNTRTTPEQDYISQETVGLINEAIEQLPPRCKLAFKLVREDKMKYKDAAQHLGISVKTLEVHLCNAVKKIEKILSTTIMDTA